MRILSKPYKLATIAGVLSLLLSSCSVKQASITPEGLLNVLGPSPSFNPENPPKDWIIVRNGKIKKNQLQIAIKNGTRSLKVTNAENSFIIARRINAMMLATPFLSWSWLVEQQSTFGYHPLRIVIGFYGGDPKSRAESRQSLKWLGNTFPRHDRIINLTWGESALQRGTLMNTLLDNSSMTSSYIVRGGRENTGSWWLEAVDVSTLYRKSWPKDNKANARIVFIGIAAEAQRFSAPTQFSNIKLFR